MTDSLLNSAIIPRLENKSSLMIFDNTRNILKYLPFDQEVVYAEDFIFIARRTS